MLTVEEREALYRLMAGNGFDSSVERLTLISTGMHEECYLLQEKDVELW